MTGERLFKLTDNNENNDFNATTTGQDVYDATGVLETVQENIISSNFEFIETEEKEKFIGGIVKEVAVKGISVIFEALTSMFGKEGKRPEEGGQLKEFAETNNIDIILSSKQMLIGKSSLDMTDKILKTVNKNVTKIEIIK